MRIGFHSGLERSVSDLVFILSARVSYVCNRMRHLNQFLAPLMLVVITISMMQVSTFVLGDKEQPSHVKVSDGIAENALSNRIAMQEGEAGAMQHSLQYTAMLLIPAIVVLIGSLFWSWSLKRQVDSKTSELKVEIAERERMQESKNRLMSAITHELRTPLVSIVGYLDYVLTGKLGPLSEKVESSLQIVKQESDRLLTLTNDLLDIRRMEFGKFQLAPEPLDFKEVIDHCTHEIQPLIREKKQQFKVEVLEGRFPVDADRTRLCQALMNLLSNSVKFTPEGGEIILHVEADADNIKAQVSDTGLGINKEDLTRVFEPFAAIKKPSYIKGTGLGLSLTKGLVEAHGGKIWAESPGEGKGSTFTFTLPIHEKKEAR